MEKAIHRNWPLLRSKLKFRHPELNADDLYFEAGDEDLLVEKIGRKTGRSKDQVVTEINALLVEV